MEKLSSYGAFGFAVVLFVIQSNGPKADTYPVKICIDNQQDNPFHTQLLYDQPNSWGECRRVKPNHFGFTEAHGIQCYTQQVDDACQRGDGVGDLFMDVWLFVDLKNTTLDAGRHRGIAVPAKATTLNFTLYPCGQNYCSKQN